MPEERHGGGGDGEGALQPGDPWKEHYRGSRYHYNPKREFWWSVAGSSRRVLAKAGHEDILDELLRLRPDGGSLRITETSSVLMRKVGVGLGIPIYVTEYGGPIIFDHLDVSGDGLEPGDLWTGFYDGARYSFQDTKIWWNNPEDGTKRLTVERLPVAVLTALRTFKPDGGSFRVTENGVVLTLIAPQPMPPRLKIQYDALSNTQKQLVWVKVQSTQMLPVYISRYYDGFTLQPFRKLTDPLSAEDEAAISAFLKRYHGRGEGARREETELPEFEDDQPEEDIA